MNYYRIELTPLPQWTDARGKGVQQQITNFLGIEVDKVITRDVYTVMADITAEEAERVAEKLVNPVLQSERVFGENGSGATDCDFLVSVGFKPGVTDNVGRSAHEAIGDIIGRKLTKEEQIFSSIEYMLYGKNLTGAEVEKIAKGLLANELIQSVKILFHLQEIFR